MDPGLIKRCPPYAFLFKRITAVTNAVIMHKRINKVIFSAAENFANLSSIPNSSWQNTISAGIHAVELLNENGNGINLMIFLMKENGDSLPTIITSRPDIKTATGNPVAEANMISP